MYTVKFLLLNPATAVENSHYKHVKRLECIEVYMRNGKLGDFSIKIKITLYYFVQLHYLNTSTTKKNY